MKKYLLLILTLICAATITATAQQNVTVLWNCSSKTLPNGNVELLFDATIPDGFRLYSPYNPEGASKPLLIKFDDKTKFTTDGKIIELQKPTEQEQHYGQQFSSHKQRFPPPRPADVSHFERQSQNNRQETCMQHPFVQTTYPMTILVKQQEADEKSCYEHSGCNAAS